MSASSDSRRRRLALLSASFDDEFQARVLRAAERAAREHGMDFVGVSGGVLGLDSKRFVYDFINEDNTDAVLIAAHTIGHHSTLTEIQQFVDKFAHLPRVALGVELEGVPTLLIDNEIGMHAVVSHLIEGHGIRRIAFVTGPAESAEAEARYQGYCRALSEHGIALDSDFVVHGQFSGESGARAVSVLFDQRRFSLKEVEAIACVDDITALGVLDELDRRDLRVPRDLALVGFDDIEFARHAKVPLTTVRQPFAEQIGYAVQALSDALSGKPLDDAQVTFKTEFVKRRSCGCRLRRQSVFPSWSSIGKKIELQPALRQRWSKVVADLARTAFEVSSALPDGWEERLLNAFATQVMAPGTTEFFEAFEDTCYALMRSGEEVAIAVDALVVLRRHAMQCVGEAEERSRVDDLLQDSLLIASDLAAIAQSQRRYQQLQRMLELGEVSAALLAAPDLSSLANTAARHLPRLGIRSGVIALFSEPNRAESDLKASLVFDQHGQSSLGMRYASRNLAPEGYLAGRSVVVEPLSFRDERLGLALFEYGTPEMVLYEELREVLSAALKGALLTRALEAARREVEALAVTDALTGLSNRRHLTQRMREEFARSLRHRGVLSVIILDLDGFKQVNDRLGHAAGDRTLSVVAERLKQGLRVIDTVARFGGDEFVLLLPKTSATEACQIAARIEETIRVPPVDALGLVTASLGVATFDPSQDHSDEDQLLRRADRALLEAKRRGKARVVHAEELAARDSMSDSLL